MPGRKRSECERATAPGGGEACDGRSDVASDVAVAADRLRRPLAMAMPLGDGVELDSDDDAEATGRRLEAWERAYANAKSWEALEEDESGRLRGLDPTVNQRAKRCAPQRRA